MGFTSIFLILKGYKKSSIAVLVLSFLLVISNFVNISSKKAFDNNLQVTIIDVGQGSSTLIQTPGGQNILVDGGGFSDISTFDTGRYIIAPFLWKKRIGTIDYVILTHPESDHLNGLLFILDNFSVKILIKNRDSRDSTTYDNMMKICKKNNIKIYNPLEHDKNFDLNSVKLRFFNSSKEIFSYNLNNNSLVFKLIYNNFSMLFPGDILQQREKNLSRLMGIDLHSDVILSPHHGSSSSSIKVFLEKVSPVSVVISCGWHNRYNFPDNKVLKRYNAMGINIFRTDENGAVFVSSDGKNHTIKTFRNE
jgi:competence protein ComEC